jgi:hypothetical protein
VNCRSRDGAPTPTALAARTRQKYVPLGTVPVIDVIFPTDPLKMFD